MAQEEFFKSDLADVIEQWCTYLSILRPAPGDRIVDVGCASGDAERFLLQQYADIGQVVGIENDPKRHAQALAKWEQDGRPAQIEFRMADGRDLPLTDESFDAALCVEALEWVDPPLQALSEIRRVLKAGGRAIIIHTDFDTQVFSARDKQLCRRIALTFSDSGPNGQIGRQLYGLCQQAGFRIVRPTIYTLVNTEWRADRYAFRVARMMVDWLQKVAAFPEDDLSQWLKDLEIQAATGGFFYSINRNICYCEK